MLKCTKCGEIKEETLFEKGRRQCNPCRNKRQVELRSTRRHVFNDALKASRRADPVRFMLYDAKQRATRQGVPFNIQTEDIVFPSHCPVLGIPLIVSDKVITDNSPTLDKFIPELGYVKGNVSVISFKANTMKQKATSDEVYKLYLWMKQKENTSDLTQSGCHG